MTWRYTMSLLSVEAFGRARDYICQHARSLEQARFSYAFEGGSTEAVLDALAPYQNDDGGFGHGLEPDLRLPDSSVLVTTVGLQILREVHTAADHPLVEGAMRYLLAAYDAENQVWPIIPPTADEAPHAPWWDYSDDLAAGWGGFQANPRAEIVGYLFDYGTWVPDALRDEVLQAQLHHLDACTGKMEMHDLMCYVSLAESESLPPKLRSEVVSKLKPVVDRTVVKDPGKWGSYGLTPLGAVHSPGSAFAEGLVGPIDQNLDYVIEQQAPSGAWEPNWTWGGRYPETWVQAKTDWSGVLTFSTLRTLRDFDRLAATAT
jgi:hypothetical protein